MLECTVLYQQDRLNIIGSFRLDYEYEIEYEYDFSILVCIIKSHKGVPISFLEPPSLPKTNMKSEGSGNVSG